MLLESLETRQLLSATPLTANQESALEAGLGGLDDLAGHVDSLPSLNRSLPLLNRMFQSPRVGDAVDAQGDVAAALKRYFTDPLRDHIAAGSTTDSILAELGGLDSVDGTTTFDVANARLIEGGGTADSFVFDTTLHTTRTVEYALDLGPDAEAAGLEISPGVLRTADFTWTLDLQFGLDAGGEFFAVFDRLQTGVTDTAQVVATETKPSAELITEPIDLTLLINDDTTINATLPATRSGELTPIAERLTQALAEPLREVGLEGGIVGVDVGGHLALRSVSADIASIEVLGVSDATLGFSVGQRSDTEFDPRFDSGLVRLQTDTGGIAVVGVLDITPDDGGDGRLDVNELSAGVITTASRGRGSLSASVRPSSAQVQAGRPVITGSVERVFGDYPVSITTDDFAGIDTLHQQSEQALVESLAAITQFGTRIEIETALGESLPAVDHRFVDSIDVDEFLRDNLQRALETQRQANDRLTWREVQQTLQSQAGVSSVSLVQNDQTVALSIELDQTHTENVPLAIGDLAADAGFVVSEEDLPSLPMTTTLDWSLDVVVERSEVASPLEAAAITFDQVTHSVRTDVQNQAFRAAVGLLGMDASLDANMDAQHRIVVGDGSAVTAQRLLGEAAEDLWDTTTSGDAAVDVSLTGSLGGQTFAASLVLSGGPVFGGNLELTVPAGGFGEVSDFENLTAEQFAGGLSQLGEWFGDYANQYLDGDLPFAEGRMDRVIELQRLFEETISSRLKDDEGTLNFSTLQQFDEIMDSSFGGVSFDSYDADTGEVRFAVAMSGDYLHTQDLSFNIDVADLARVSIEGADDVDPQVSFDADVSLNFTLGMDLSPLGDTPRSLVVDESLALSDLAGGLGVPDLEAGSAADVRVNLRSGETVDVSLNGAATVGDVVSRLSAASNDLVATLYEVNGVTTGIRLMDSSQGQNAFSLAPINGSLAGVALGIIGEAFSDDESEDGSNEVAVFDGAAIHGDTIAHHVFVEQIDGAIAGGRVAVSTTTLVGSAVLGFQDITLGSFQIGDAAAPTEFTHSVGLPQTRMTAAELFDSLGVGANESMSLLPTFGGELQFTLPSLAIFPDGEDNDDAEDRVEGALTVTITDFGGSLSGAIDDFASSVLRQLSQLEAGDVLGAVRDGLSDLLSFTGIELPVFDISVVDAAGVQALLDNAIAAVDNIGGATLDVLSDGVRRLASLDPELPAVDFPELDVTLPQLFSFAGEVEDQQPDDEGNYSLAAIVDQIERVFDFDLGLFDDASGPDEVAIPAAEYTQFIGGVSSIIETLSLDGPGNLTALETVLEDALGLDNDGVSLQLITGDDAIEVRLDIALGQMIQRDYPIDVDLNSLGVNLDGVGDLLDVGGSANVTLRAGVMANVALGIEVATEGQEVATEGQGNNAVTTVTPFLYTGAEGSTLTLTAGAVAENIDFEASLGPLGIGVVDGVARVSRSEGSDAPASFTVSMDDTTGGQNRYLFNQTPTFSSRGEAVLSAELPIEFPVGSPLTTLVVGADVDDLIDGTTPDVNADEVQAAIQAAIDDFDVGENLLALVGGWEGAFDLLTDAMRGEVFGLPLPLIGDALADEADFLTEIKNSVVNNLSNYATIGQDLARRELFEALGPDGLNWLGDQTGDGRVSVEDIGIEFNAQSDEVLFDIRLEKAAETLDVGADFDLGLPGLNLDLDAEVLVDFGFTFDLVFGVGIDDGFFFDTENSGLEVRFDASVPELDATGQLAFLGMEATSGLDAAGNAETRLGGRFNVRFNEPSGDDRLTLREMFAAESFSELIETELTASADANLAIVVSADSAGVLPRLRTDLIVDWDFVAGQDDSVPSVSFENVQMNLGDFFSGFVGDTLRGVQQVLAPAQPVIDVLTDRLPVISDLGGSDVTLADLARLFGRADIASFIDSVNEINTLVQSLPTDLGDDTWVDLGAFDVDGSSLGGLKGAKFSPPPIQKPASIQGDATTRNPFDGPAFGEGTSSKSWQSSRTKTDGQLSFPLLESPITAFELLLGKDVDLFTYDAPGLALEFGYNQSFPTPIPGLFAEIGGRVGASADFAFGFDTTGINRFSDTGNVADIFDGFFVSDRINPDGTGDDVPEVTLSGSLTAGGKLSVLVAEGGVRGGVFADVLFNLNDPDGDGRVRAGEIAGNVLPNPIHIFDVSGGMDAGVEGFYRVLFIEDTFTIAEANLLNFDIPRPAPGPSPESILTTRNGGELTLLFTGGDDDYKVLPGSQNGSVVIQGRGLITGDITGVTSIIGDAGDGDDVVTISPDVFLPITIHGGAGDDRLTAGSGETTFHGGLGNDVMTGGIADDRLFGDSGDDTIIGGEGDDDLSGGEGDDFVEGGRGADVIAGGDGDDNLKGGFGVDEINGGAGNDVIDGGVGDDHLVGGDGDDRITGDRGDDRIIGGDGDDDLSGDEGADTIDGDAGDDVIRGGQRNDVLRGGEGSDEIDGDAGGDEIHGGGGDDVIRGGLGGDTIYGDGGNDRIFADLGETTGDATEHFIDAGDGDDVVYGSLGDDVVIGGDGDDRIHALGGSDVVWGGAAAYDASQFDLGDPSRFELPPRLAEVNNLIGRDYEPAKLMTPVIVSGASVGGVVGDGADEIHGGDGDDFLFGGGDADTILGDGGDDYVDGGSGNDAGVFGGDGDDVVRGGVGSDFVDGGAGLDQVYGDAGRDELHGGSGDASGNLVGQTLYGGEGVDTLRAFSGATSGSIGEALFGGGGGDFLYGVASSEFLFGEGGPDYIDGAGGDDVLDGDLGQDQLYGGDGDDELRGGEDGDWLEGQSGSDTLVGGGGIDFMALDVGSQHAVADTDSFDGDGSSDDNANDVLLIAGTTGDDQITLSQSDDQRLRVDYNGQIIPVTWRNAAGPLVEQFRIDTGLGNDMVEFDVSLDLSVLSERTGDWVTFVDAGPGDDTIMGSSGRDRIDGGRGSDTIFGFGGDDRLWGDQGPGDGTSDDSDTIYAGTGNDDVLGGQGNNALYAWSSDPAASEPFGIIDPATRQLEDTGLNRLIGGPGDDWLYGGTGVDLLYGAGGDNVLHTREGETFESLDGGNAGREWIDYAKQSDQVWYVGGSNVDDLITVSFVTEPGILQGHHLVTRLTNNNGAFTFDAQVRLDFGATDRDGNLVWDPDALFSGGDITNADPQARAELLQQRFTDEVSLSRLLPPEDDFRVIVVDALAGDDIVSVGPTVQKTVWVDAGAGDDEVTIQSGRSILIDQTDSLASRNDLAETAYRLSGPLAITGQSIAMIDGEPNNGRLNEDATFWLIVDELDDHVRVDVPVSMTDGTQPGSVPNATLDDLIADINRVLDDTSASGLVIATNANGAIALSSTRPPSDRSRLAITADDAAVTQLGLPADASFVGTQEPPNTLAVSTTFAGLTIDNPGDVDFYEFAVGVGKEFDIDIDSFGVDDGMTHELTQLETVGGLTTYRISVTSDQTPTIYELTIDLRDGFTPVVSDLAAEVAFERRDVIFGGAGNDVLVGGPAEDFIFGGPGHDILSGGDDRGAGDLLFGEGGDDKFQTIPGDLPTLMGTETTFVPTQSDRYDGGTGDDSVVYLGSDQRDLISARSNRLLGRYEISDGSRQHYFTTVRTEAMVVDLLAGDDEFRGDGGFRFEGDSAEWGFSIGDAQAAGGGLLSFRIIGGPGNDRIIGTPNDDILIGGEGLDFIAGGLGDDVIDGGTDNDILAGNTTLVADAYEFVTIQDRRFDNGSFSSASTLPRLSTASPVRDLTFHAGDAVDVYLVQPSTSLEYAGQSTPAGLRERIRAVADGGGELNVDIIGAINVGTSANPIWEPAEPSDTGVPAAFFVSVDAPEDSDGNALQTRYELRLNAAEVSTIDVSADALVRSEVGGEDTTGAGGFERDVFDFGIGAGGRGVFIPAGDFNGDGSPDQILMLHENIENSSIDGRVTTAYLYLGDGLFDPSIGDVTDPDVIAIQMPFPMTSFGFGGQTVIGDAGDLDGDGIDDLVFSLVGRDTVVALFGSRDLSDTTLSIDDRIGLTPFRTAVISSFPSGFNGEGFTATVAGDLVGSEPDDLVVSHPGGVTIYPGRDRQQWSVVREGANVDNAPAAPGDVASVGDLDGDGRDDFAVVTRDELVVFYGDGSGDIQQMTSMRYPAPNSGAFAGMTIETLPGRSMDIDGNGHADLVLRGFAGLVGSPGTSYVALGDSNRSIRFELVSVGLLQPVGDLDGDGRVDLAAPVMEPAFIPDGGVFIGGTPVFMTTHVYLSRQNVAEPLMIGDRRPDLIIKDDDTAIIGELRGGQLFATPLIGSPGDVNDDGRDDLAILPLDQLFMNVIYGDELSAADATGSDVDANDPLDAMTNSPVTRLDRGWVVTRHAGEGGAQPGIDILDPDSVNLADAVTIENNRPGANASDVDRINGTRAIGDINNDGSMDMIITGRSGSYLVFGPFDETGVIGIDGLSNLRFGHGGPSDDGFLIPLSGEPINGFGDVNGDGIDDLVLDRDDPFSTNNATMELVTFYGGHDVANRLLDDAPDDDRVIDLGTNTGVFGTDKSLIDFDGSGTQQVVHPVDSIPAVDFSREPEPAKFDDFIAVRLLSIDGTSPEVTLQLNLRNAPLDRPAGYASQNTDLRATGLGDINGDGFDDLAVVLTDPMHIQNDFDIGHVFVVMGGNRTSIDLGSQSNAQWSLPGGIESAVALGDLDGDGYDEFALVRGREGSDDRSGKVLIYRGGASWATAGGSPVDPWLTLSQADLPPALQLRSDNDLSVATGDLDGDGRADLVLSRADVIMHRLNSLGTQNQDNRGATWVFFDIEGVQAESGADAVVKFDDADRIYVGVRPTDQSGFVLDERLVDYNDDGIDDLMIGSLSYDGQFAVSTVSRVRFIPGGMRPIALPDAGDRTVLQNRGSNLVDPETGEAVRFEGADFQLGDGVDERWYQFTTVGDGIDGGQDYVRVDAGLGDPGVRMDLVDASGRPIETDQTRIDFRGLNAATYYLRVRRSPEHFGEQSFALEFAPPQVGESLPVRDRDRIFGGLGDDALIGGLDADVLRGDAGNDVFVGENELEAVDLVRFTDGGPEDREDTFERQSVDPVPRYQDEIVSPDRVSSKLRRGIAVALGHPVTYDGDGDAVTHRPWSARQLAQIESIDLSASELTVDDLAGIDQVLPSLRRLDLSSNDLDHVPTSLARMPHLEELILDDNQIRDLSPLAGIQIIDDGEAGYESDGRWQIDNRGSDGIWQGVYRYNNDGGSATWTFDVPEGAQVDLFATWPIQFIDDPQDVTFTMEGVVQTDVIGVDQTVQPGTSGATGGENVSFGGSPWENLGRFDANAARVAVTLRGVDGQRTAADAIRLEMVDPPKLPWRSLSLANNPLDRVSRQEIISRLTDANPDLTVSVTGISPISRAVPTAGEILSFDDSPNVESSTNDEGEWVLSPNAVTLQTDREISTPSTSYQFGSLFVDANRNGIRDVGEIFEPSPGLRVVDSAGNLVACTSTDSQGNYRIPALLQSDDGLSYKLVLPDGYAEDDTATQTEARTVRTAVTFAVEAANVAPDVSLDDRPTGAAGGRLNVSGSFVDPDDDLWLGSVDFGDGNRRPLVIDSAKTFSIDHVYDRPGTYRVTVTIDDQAGGIGTRSFDVTADPFAPTGILAGGVVARNVDTRNGPVFVSRLDVQDETASDRHTFTLISGDGDVDNDQFTIVGNELSLRKNADAPGSDRDQYTVRIEATDAVGQSIDQTITIDVADLPTDPNNEPVTIDSIGINEPGIGQTQRSVILSVHVSFTDAINFDATAFVVRRRDGSGIVPSTAIHNIDDDGGSRVTIRFLDDPSDAAVDPDDLVRPGGSLRDGYYELHIDASRLTAADDGRLIDGDDDGSPGGNFSFGTDEADNFFALYGANRGLPVVGRGEYVAFCDAFGTMVGDPDFDEAFDFRGVGAIGETEHQRFRDNLHKRLVWQ